MTRGVETGIMDSDERQKQADRILFEFGLLEKLKDYGTPHIVGSYRMDMMAWNDLDIDIENEDVTVESLYDLSQYLIKTFRPVWYEAKETQDESGKTVWFHGFETTITGELWNVDLWFFDKKTIKEMEAYCDGIKERATAEQKNTIVAIKKELTSRNLYSFDKYKSMDVYEAVLEHRVKNAKEFLALYE